MWGVAQHDLYYLILCYLILVLLSVSSFTFMFFLSLSLSMESFIKYIDDEIKQNAINALNAVSKVCVSKEKAKRGPKNTSRFLVH